MAIAFSSWQFLSNSIILASEWLYKIPSDCRKSFCLAFNHFCIAAIGSFEDGSGFLIAFPRITIGPINISY
jgi:hypothetical protein